ncbi:hypothetical protein [Spiroplasma ixodetis]|uniref:Uncharacterized protein n=1 Tax=Spiroplasma ixodetis TaxID=2141 RepID=A0ABN7BSH5_9MOLU
MSKDDYESITFNFNFNMNAIYSNKYLGLNYTNSKNWFTPIIIKLNDIGNIADSEGLNAIFQDYNSITCRISLKIFIFICKWWSNI